MQGARGERTSSNNLSAGARKKSFWRDRLHRVRKKKEKNPVILVRNTGKEGVKAILIDVHVILLVL